LAARPVPIEAVALSFPGFAAGRAALRFIGISLGGVEFLFISGECESLIAVRTLQRFVCESHWMTSFHAILG
jgi:hypothetical protein